MDEWDKCRQSVIDYHLSTVASYEQHIHYLETYTGEMMHLYMIGIYDWSNKVIELRLVSSKTDTHRTLNSTAWLAYRAHGYVNSVNNPIVKHRYVLVTNCH